MNKQSNDKTARSFLKILKYIKKQSIIREEDDKTEYNKIKQNIIKQNRTALKQKEKQQQKGEKRMTIRVRIKQNSKKRLNNKNQT